MTSRPAPIRLEVLSGSLGGRAYRFDEGPVTIGRASECLVRFDPSADLDVSGLHARLTLGPDGWSIEDLASTNGTFVNGTRTTRPHPLREGDVVRLGHAGPEIRAHTDAALATDGPRSTARRVPPESVQPGDAAPSTAPSLGDGRARRPWRMAAVWGAVVLTGASAFWVGRDRERGWASEREQLLLRVDSLLAVQGALEQERASALAQLTDSLSDAHDEVQRLRSALAAATPASSDRSDIEELERRLQEAVVQLQRQQLSADLDFEAIRRQVEPAVAMLWSERADGTVLTGTGVSIDASGTLLTNRHVVAPKDGPRSLRLAVQFAGSSQVWRATLVETHPTADLAWARPEGIEGAVPKLDRVNARADTIQPGSVVAIVGFPLGGRPEVASPDTRRRAVVSVGVLLGREGDELRIQGYGAQGASGSPVVDRDGRLIGLVYGAEVDTSILLAVPIALATSGR